MHALALRSLKDRSLKDRLLKDRLLKDRSLKDRSLKDRSLLVGLYTVRSAAYTPPTTAHRIDAPPSSQIFLRL